MNISILFVGELQDSGFNQSALSGAERMRAAHPGQIEIVSGIPYDASVLTDALRQAATHSDGVVVVGGQGNLATPAIAAEFPDRSFAIVQGNVRAPNIASYDVLQEQSAFLAGVLAARITQTGIVAHLSGHRVVPGLKSRAAFVSGVHYIDASIPVLTGFCGTQDDSKTTESWTHALAGAGADIVFTMLNAARHGAIQACRAAGIRQIGNVTDWCATDPEVFVSSALARIDLGVERAVLDIRDGLCPEIVQELDLAQGAVGLAMAPDVQSAIRKEVAEISDLIATGQISIETAYDGPEFEIGT